MKNSGKISAILVLGLSLGSCGLLARESPGTVVVQDFCEVMNRTLTHKLKWNKQEFMGLRREHREDITALKREWIDNCK